jgi:hypothetical protein
MPRRPATCEQYRAERGRPCQIAGHMPGQAPSAAGTRREIAPDARGPGEITDSVRSTAAEPPSADRGPRARRRRCRRRRYGRVGNDRAGHRAVDLALTS